MLAALGQAYREYRKFPECLFRNARSPNSSNAIIFSEKILTRQGESSLAFRIFMVADNWTGPLATRIDVLVFTVLGAPFSVHGFSITKSVANNMVLWYFDEGSVGVVFLVIFSR